MLFEIYLLCYLYRVCSLIGTRTDWQTRLVKTVADKTVLLNKPGLPGSRLRVRSSESTARTRGSRWQGREHLPLLGQLGV